MIESKNRASNRWPKLFIPHNPCTVFCFGRFATTTARARCLVQVVAEQRPPSASAAGSGQAYDSAVSVGSVGLQVVESLAVLAAVPAILTARELLLPPKRRCDLRFLCVCLVAMVGTVARCDWCRVFLWPLVLCRDACCLRRSCGLQAGGFFSGTGVWLMGVPCWYGARNGG